jgi:hypothetical protein
MNKQLSVHLSLFERKGRVVKKYKKQLMLGAFFVAAFSTTAHATRITTGNMSATTTAASPQVSNISATPSAVIRLDLGGANYITSGGQLSVSITVDTSTPSVTAGTAANQTFRDDTVGAAFFGYYLTTGVRSSNQSAANVNVKVKKGSGETANRSYYLLGNGTSTPDDQSDLTIAPAVATTFATAAANGVHCGPSHVSNGLSGAAIGCTGGSTVANMDVTQFVKVLYSDPTSSAIVSQLEFTAVNE